MGSGPIRVFSNPIQLVNGLSNGVLIPIEFSIKSPKVHGLE